MKRVFNFCSHVLLYLIAPLILIIYVFILITLLIGKALSIIFNRLERKRQEIYKNIFPIQKR